MSLGASWADQLITGYYEDPDTEFMINRAILRKHAEELGIFPSQQAVEEHVKTIPYFGGMTGQFDEEKFERFKKNSLGSLSLTNADFVEMIRDELRFRQIADLITGEVQAVPSISKTIAESQLQIVDLAYTLVNRAKFEESLEISEEDIKAFWEENKERYLTDEQRQVEFLKIALKDEFKVPPLPAEDPLPEDATEEQKQAAASKRATLSAERQAKQDELDALLFFAGETLVLEQIVNEQEGADFMPAAKSGIALIKEILKPDDYEDAGIAEEDLDKLVITTGQTELFTANEVPEELNFALKRVSRQRGPSTPAEAVFSVNVNGDEADKVSNLLVLPDGSTLAFKVTNSVASEPLPYEKARSQARADLRSKRLDESVTKATEDLVKALEEGLAAGKSAKELITAAGFEYKEALAIDASKPAPELPNFGAVFANAVKTNPNSVGEPVEQSSTLDAEGNSVSEGKVVFVVKDRRIAISADNDRKLDQVQSSINNRERGLLFREWFREKQLSSELEIFATPQN